MKKLLWATDFSPHAHDAGLQVLACIACITDLGSSVEQVVRHAECPVMVVR